MDRLASVHYNLSGNDLIPHSNSVKPNLVESFRSLFYLILPSESKFEDVSRVPDYTSAVSMLCNKFTYLLKFTQNGFPFLYDYEIVKLYCDSNYSI